MSTKCSLFSAFVHKRSVNRELILEILKVLCIHYVCYRLILCGGQISPVAAQLLREHNIAAIQVHVIEYF